jgi:hypothetical protein
MYISSFKIFYSLFEGSNFDIASYLSNTSNLFLTSIFFSPLLPVSIIICFIGMIFSYWVEKVFFIFLSTPIFRLFSFAEPRSQIKWAQKWFFSWPMVYLTFAFSGLFLSFLFTINYIKNTMIMNLKEMI